MSYRMEIDALNALVKEQQRTNELLEIIAGKKKQGNRNRGRKIRNITYQVHRQKINRGEKHENVKPTRSATRKTGK